jgi:2,4-didehydro-3-deoxy-L-rhamnonate hydrolase
LLRYNTMRPNLLLSVVTAAGGTALAVAAALGVGAASSPDRKGRDPLDLERLRRVEIAPLAEALTFARATDAGGPHVLAVTRYEGGRVTGVDLSRLFGRAIADPLELVAERGFDELHRAIAGAGPADMRVVEAGTLGIPLDLRDHHIAAGTNYPEHAGDAGVEDGPFLFAKLVPPTAPDAPVRAAEALLDYEVELAWVTVAPLGATAAPAVVGLILCNDYTDRALLLRHVDPWDPTSGKGFTTGKSLPGYLPVGNLFVVPRDPRAFAAALDLRLWVNGELRQQSLVSAQVWDLDAMLRETWARRDVTWMHLDGRMGLLPAGADRIPDRTLLMSGTPGGTVFEQIALGTKLAGAWAWISSGGRGPIAAQVVEAYIRDARAAKRYLQPGDRVTIHVDRLGIIDNHVTP